MQVGIGVADAAASADLFDWLRADVDLVRNAEVRPGPADPEKLGALEFIDVVLGQVAAMTSLALAIEAWRRSRSRPDTVVIRRPDGATLTLPSGDAGNAEAIRQFLAGEDGGSGQAGQ